MKKVRVEIAVTNEIGAKLSSSIVETDEPLEDDYWLLKQMIEYLHNEAPCLYPGDTITLKEVND